MKYRWVLGLLVSLTSCSQDGDSGEDPSGGSGGQPGVTGGSPSTPKGGNAATGGVSPGAGGGGKSSAPTGGTPGGGAPQGGAPSGGTPSGGAGNAGGANGGAGNAGGSNGGTPPNGGSPPTGGSGGGAPPTVSGGSVLERNGNPTRDGHWVQAGLTKTAAAKMTFQADFKATFKGSMYASPLYVEKGPGGKGAFVAASTENEVTAFDETTGAVLWSKDLGESATQGCFGSDPVGILSTPVIDGKTGTIYVAAAIGSAGKGVSSHEIHALSIEDGSEKTGWPVSVGGMKSGSVTFAPQYQNQRSALSLVNGVVYVGYGGFIGDCNDYRGWIVAVDAADASKTGAWATAGKGEAIWAAGGFASDGTAIFPVTGNSTVSGGPSSRDQSSSEAVLRITGLSQFDGSDKSEFYPSQWKSMDTADADLGGSNSMLVTIPGSTPEKVVVAIGKDGRMFLLDPNNLGGEDGSVVELQVASTSSGAQGAVKTAPTAYQTAKGTYIAFTADSGPECPTAVNGKAIMSVRISPGAPPTADVAWCAPGPTGQNPSTAPISTTSDGKSDAIVWYINGGQLKGVDGDTGESVFGGEGSCSGVQRWTSPIAVKNRIITGANGQLCSWAAP
jgi:hypothetical protein